MSGLLGRPHIRVDGKRKVTGEARYAAEHHQPGLLHGVLVSATIARGRIKRIDASAALAEVGVLHVLTHENRPSLPWFDRSYTDDDAPAGSPFRPLYNATILFDSQPIALVVADTFETARAAARLMVVEYDVEAPETDLAAQRARAREPSRWTLGRKPPPKARGDVDAALAAAAARVDVEYGAAAEYHNPMELFASTVMVESDGSLTIYDKTQSALSSQSYVTRVFDMDKDQVRVVSPFVGGAFGSGLRPQHQLFFAVMAARELGRSVRVGLTRQQMFTFGYRPRTLQRVQLGADANGRVTAISHDAVAETSRFEDYAEVVVNWGSLLYAPEASRATHQLVPLDLYTPLDMRAPGAATGVYALECAMDELAAALGMDPLELRLRNESKRAVDEDKDFSSKELRACYEQAAERFGWRRRSAAPRSMRDGEQLVGWGMATGAWEALQLFANARATLSIDGTLRVASATADIGTGTYTVMTQIAADALGLPVEAVTFKLGDTNLPWAPLQGGSWTAVTVGSAVKVVCDAIADKLVKLAAKTKGGPLEGAQRDEVVFEQGELRSASDPSRRISIPAAMRAAGVLTLEDEQTALPSPERTKYAHYAHCASFVEVKVDDALGMVRVTRVVIACAVGKVLNPKTARSQILGGVVMGIGMALHEEAQIDHHFGRVMNHSLAEYHVPVNADVPEIDVIFVDEPDQHVNALGAKGLGEIGIVGIAAAVANAIFHATGKRVRELPITLDKLL